MKTTFIKGVLDVKINLGRIDIFVMLNLYVVPLFKCIWCISGCFVVLKYFLIS